MRYPRVRVAVLVLGISLLVIPAGTAQAGELRTFLNISGLHGAVFSGSPGEANDVAITQTGTNQFSITDALPITPPPVGAADGCTVSTYSATCNVQNVAVNLGDGSDRANVASATPLGYDDSVTGTTLESVVIAGEGGDDTLSASAPASTNPGDRAVGLYGETQHGALGLEIVGFTFPPDVPGNDTLTGGDENDVIYGGPGDDNISSGAGNDQIDNGYYSNQALPNGTAGSDTIDAGPGIDKVTGAEAHSRNLSSATPDAPDTIACGSGDDTPPDPRFVGDQADAGASDLVDTDCEAIFVDYACPADGPIVCNVALDVTATVDGTTALKAAGHKSRSHKIVLGEANAKVPRGQHFPISVHLKRGKVKQALRKRKTAPARQTIVTKKLGKESAKFRLRK
ncbi:MAG: hypothetical protein QOG62_2835 [Thermoleophilaceae bacterium]|jgi:hypothetical protein|nr:hypothetical protein [Thermoleophilaceae bacterium]